MALGSLPPWLQINPRDYLLATQAGVQAGHAIAESTQRAWEEQERMKMAAEQQKSAAQQRAIENAAQRLAADRLEQYRQSEIANRTSELGIQRQGLGLRGEGLDIQRQKVEEIGKTNEQRFKDQQQRMDDLQKQREFMNDMRTREADRRDREAGRSRQGHFIQKDGMDFVIPPGETNAVPVNFPKPPEGPQSHAFRDAVKGISGSLLSNFNVMGMHPFMSTPTPAAGTNAPSAIPATPLAAPPSPKKRVKVKGPSGQTGTIEEGDSLPDGWSEAK